MTRRALVTGAAGLIGFEVTRQLLEAGSDVVGVDSFHKGGDEDLQALSRSHPGQMQIMHADLAKPGSTRDIVGPFDSVFHLAAIVGVGYVMAHPYETLRVNLLSTIQTLDLAMETGARVFHFASSSETYASGVDAGHTALPTPEGAALCITDVSAPRSSYAASKIAGESMVFAAATQGLTPVVLRFHNVYGPRMGPTHVIPELAQRICARTDPFPLYGSQQTRSFLHVEDAARAVVTVDRAAHAGNAGIYHVGSDEEIQIGALADQMFDLAGWRPRIEARPAPPGSVRRRVPDVSRLKALGFAPRLPLVHGLRQVLDAYARGTGRPAKP